MKVDIDLAEILKRKYPRGFHAPADIDIDLLLEFGDDDWTHEIDLHEHLARRHAIALVWDADMLVARHPRLTEGQAWEALRECRRLHAAEEGLCWGKVDAAVGGLFPEAPEARRRLLDRAADLCARVLTLPDGVLDDPAFRGPVTAALDSLDAATRGS